MILNKLRQLHLLLNHRPPLLTLTFIRFAPLPPALTIIFFNLLRKINPLFRFVVFLLVSSMVDLQCPPHDHGAAQIVHGQICAPLILVLQKRETFGFAGLLVANEINVRRFAILGEYGDYVALGELEREASDVNIGSIAVVCMP